MQTSLGVARVLNPAIVVLKAPSRSLLLLRLPPSSSSSSSSTYRRARSAVRKSTNMTGVSITHRSKPSPSSLLLRQLFEKDSSTYTYLLADVGHPDRPAVLVDPVDKTAERDALLVEQLGLKLLFVMNTHVHADHVTGTGLLKKKLPGVKFAISKASSATADLLLEPGQKVFFGNLYLERTEIDCSSSSSNTITENAAQVERKYDMSREMLCSLRLWSHRLPGRGCWLAVQVSPLTGFSSLAEVNEFVTNFVNKRTTFENEHKTLPCPGFIKILLRAFKIDFEDMEDTLPAWKGKSMLKNHVTGDLAPFQMFRFYNDFGVKDSTIWGDLSFEEAEVLLKTMASQQDTTTTNLSSAETMIPTTTVAPPVQQVSTPSTSRSKNGRRT